MAPSCHCGNVQDTQGLGRQVKVRACQCVNEWFLCLRRQGLWLTGYDDDAKCVDSHVASLSVDSQRTVVPVVNAKQKEKLPPSKLS